MTRSLESLLNLKRWREDEVKSLFALLLKELAIEEEKLEALEAHHGLIAQKLCEGSDEMVDIDDIRRLQQYSEQLVMQIRHQRAAVEAQDRKVEDARALLMEVSKERKTYERLDEKMRLAFEHEEQRKEQTNADERASIQHGRHRGAD